MNFEVGKYYQHTTGTKAHLICEIETTMRGKGLLAELYGNGPELSVFGTHEGASVNWLEITSEDWISSFIGPKIEEPEQ